MPDPTPGVKRETISSRVNPHFIFNLVATRFYVGSEMFDFHISCLSPGE